MTIYSQEILNEIKTKIDYYEFYSQFFTDLPNNKTRVFVVCPFHKEQVGSFQIDLELGLWRCWAEGIYGDVFNFYMRYYNVSFIEAVETLAEKYGVELIVDPEQQKIRDYKKSLYNINNIICSKYEENITKDNEAWNYITKLRGFSPKIIQEFRIGKGIDNIPLTKGTQAVGLFRKYDNDGEENYIPVFGSNRITIPIQDEYGNITSFVGRAFKGDESRKYMYTQNTDINIKTDIVFGLYQAKKYIKKFQHVIIVEGQLDMIKCYQKGIVNTVSLGGLYFSDNQINLLKKYTSTFYICVEDEAILRSTTGADNIMKSPLTRMYEKIKEHIPYAKIYVVDLRNEDGSKCDPDMFLESHEKSEFTDKIKHAKIYNEFIITSLVDKCNPKNIEEKTACINMLIPKLASIQNYLDRRQYIELVSNKLLIPENDIYKKIKFSIEKKEKIDASNLKWDSKPIYAQKILVSACFAKNFPQYKACSLVYLYAFKHMDDFYKMIMSQHIIPYISAEHKKTDSEKISFDRFFSEIMHNDNIDNLIKDTIMDCYMKSEQLSDLEEEDLEELIVEQVSTLKEYVYTEITV